MSVASTPPTATPTHERVASRVVPLHPRGGGGGGGSDAPVRRVIIRDEYRANEAGMWRVRRRPGRGDDAAVVEELTELLPVNVRLVGRVAEALHDGSPTVLTHVDLVASQGGVEHRLDAVERDRWEKCGWVGELPYGAVPFADTASGRSTLRNAIISTSGVVPLTVSHGVLGWVQIAGEHVYLHAGGGIGAAGALAARVSVPAPLAEFELPTPPTSVDELRRAWAASWACMSAAPDRVMAPMLGAAYRAPLGVSRETVMPCGARGSGKTGVAALVVQHFAPSARHHRMVGAGAGEETGGTAAGLEELRFRAGGVLLPLDDLAPDKGTERASQRAALIARSQFNRQTKLRSMRQGGIRTPHPPRSLPLVTGEESTSVESAESRIVTLRMGRGDVDTRTLAALDRGTGPTERALLMSGLIHWLAAWRDKLDGWVESTRAELAEALRVQGATDPGMDARRSESVADLGVGWRAVLAMLAARGVLTEAEVETVWQRVWEGLVECKRHLMAGSSTRTPAERVREALRSLVVQRRIFLRGIDGGRPDDPGGCGWELRGAEWEEPRGAAECLGFTDGQSVWLLPEATHAAVTGQARRADDPMDLTSRGMGEALADARVIRVERTGDGRRAAVRKRLAGTQIRVWETTTAWLFGDDDAAPEPLPDAPAPVAPVVAPVAAEADDGDGWTKLPERIGCAGCGEPASHALHGVPLHVGCEAPRCAELTPPATPVQAPAPEAPAPVRGHRRTPSASFSREVQPAEVEEAVKWSGGALSEEDAAAAVARWHDVTGTLWKGPHGTIRALIDGHTRWPGTKAPVVSDLRLYSELRASDTFWKQRSWVVTPGDPAETSTVVGVDVNAQYLASAGTVELGEGEALHYEAGEELPTGVLKMAGWVRLGKPVKDAPHGLTLTEKMWVPTPLATYLTRDRGISLDLTEALVWEKKRVALKALSGHWKRWREVLAVDESPAGRTALAMLKTVYTKALGGYLAAEDGALVPPEWHRPDWAALIRAQAEANAMRALDRLPDGVIVRAKYADSAYLEVEQGAELASWDRLDPVQPGRWKPVGPAIPAASCTGLKTADAWRERVTGDA